MSSSISDPTAPRAAATLGGWYVVFAVVALGVLCYFLLGGATPILFDVLPARAAA